MATVKLTREQFLTWLAGIPSFSRASLLADSKKGDARTPADSIEVSDNWPAASEDDALVIVLPDARAQDDFFAFVATYVSTYSPFSAFFRVVTAQELEFQYRIRDSLDLSQMVAPMTGAIVCQSVVRFNTKNFRSISLLASLASRDYCLAKAFLSQAHHEYARVSHRWTSCHKVLSNRQGVQEPDGPFWPELFSLRNALDADVVAEQRNLAPILLSLLKEKRFTDQVWLRIGEMFPAVYELQRDMSLSREVRARAFTGFVGSSAMESLGAYKDFVVGFLAAALAGGQIEYVAVLADLARFYPEAALWFGFICGCMEGSDVLAANGSLGRHVSKALVEKPCTYRGQIDISFGELRVIGNEKDGASLIKPRSNDSVWVEIVPDIAVPFSRQFDLRSVELRASESTLRDIRGEAVILTERLLNLLRGEAGGAQSDLFDKRSARKKPQKK